MHCYCKCVFESSFSREQFRDFHTVFHFSFNSTSKPMCKVVFYIILFAVLIALKLFIIILKLFNKQTREKKHEFSIHIFWQTFQWISHWKLKMLFINVELARKVIGTHKIMLQLKEHSFVALEHFLDFPLELQIQTLPQIPWRINV